MQSEKIDFCRIAELREGDKFLLSGVWRMVRSIEKGVLYYNSCTYKKHNRNTLSANSQQFVQVERKVEEICQNQNSDKAQVAL